MIKIYNQNWEIVGSVFDFTNLKAERICNEVGAFSFDCPYTREYDELLQPELFMYFDNNICGFIENVSVDFKKRIIQVSGSAPERVFNDIVRREVTQDYVAHAVNTSYPLAYQKDTWGFFDFKDFHDVIDAVTDQKPVWFNSSVVTGNDTWSNSTQWSGDYTSKHETHHGSCYMGVKCDQDGTDCPSAIAHPFTITDGTIKQEGSFRDIVNQYNDKTDPINKVYTHIDMNPVFSDNDIPHLKVWDISLGSSLVENRIDSSLAENGNKCNISFPTVGSIRITPNATTQVMQYEIPIPSAGVIVNKPMTLSFNYEKTAKTSISFYLYRAVSGAWESVSSATFTVPAGNKTGRASHTFVIPSASTAYRFVVSVVKAGGTHDKKCEITNLMLCAGSYPSPYVPYGEDVSVVANTPVDVDIEHCSSFNEIRSSKDSNNSVAIWSNNWPHKAVRGDDYKCYKFTLLRTLDGEDVTNRFFAKQKEVEVTVDNSPIKLNRCYNYTYNGENIPLEYFASSEGKDCRDNLPSASFPCPGIKQWAPSYTPPTHSFDFVVDSYLGAIGSNIKLRVLANGRVLKSFPKVVVKGYSMVVSGDMKGGYSIDYIAILDNIDVTE